jgi:hypothetical protein
MDIQKTLLEVAELEDEINQEKTRCVPPDNLPDTPIEQLKFSTYGNALVFFARVRERILKVQSLRNSLKVCT